MLALGARADAAAAPAAARRAVARPRAARSSREIFRIISELNEQEGLTVLVVEQNAALALAARAARLRARGRRASSRSRRRPSDGAARARVASATELPRATDRGRSDRLTSFLPAGRRRARHRRRSTEPRARDRADLPLDGRDQLRAGRDGDVLRRSSRGSSSTGGCRTGPRSSLTLVIAFVGGVAIERVVIRPVERARCSRS